MILGRQAGATRRLLRRLVDAGVVLSAPQELHQEVERHITHVVARSLDRRKLTGDAFVQGQRDALNAWHEVQAKLWFVPSPEYRFFEPVARRRLLADPADWPYVALALRLDCAIWTKNLAHFAESGLPIWGMGTVGLLLDE